MASRITRVLSAALALAIVGTGCGDDGTSPMDGGRSDSGGRDGGMPRDSGPRPDGGPGVDGGPGTDGGMTGIDNIMFVEDCPKFAACGGDLTGTWEYGGACITPTEAESVIAEACPEGSFVSGTGRVSGTLSFDGTTVMRDLTTMLDVTFMIPETCLPVPGLDCATIVGPAIESMVASATAVTCTGTGDCECRIQTEDTVTDSGPYTTAGSMYAITASMRQWEYCAESTGMVIHEIMGTDGDPPTEPGLQFLGPS